MSDVPWTELTSAFVFGLYAGFSPGPTLTLVISQTMRFGRIEGFKVAIAPILTDGPIVAFSLWLLHRLEGRDTILGGIALTGAVFLVVVAIECMRASSPIDVEQTVEAPRSVFKGMLANALNPHPYIGWMTIVGPSMMRAARPSTIYAGLFLVVFYGTMVGAKMIVAVATERGHAALRGGGRRALMIVLGVALLGFAAKFAAEGAGLLRSGA